MIEVPFTLRIALMRSSARRSAAREVAIPWLSAVSITLVIVSYMLATLSIAASSS